MTKNNSLVISYQLYGPRGGLLDSNEFTRAKFYSLYINNKQATPKLEFDDRIKSKKKKLEFLNEFAEILYVDELNRREEKLIAKEEKKAKVIEKELKEISKGKKDFTLYVAKRKTARGVYTNSDFIFRHWHLEFDTPLIVPAHDNKKEFKKFQRIVMKHFEAIIERALRLRNGTRIFFLKIITPQFDDNEKLLMDDELKDEKTGKVYKTKANYSYGFGIERFRVSMDNKSAAPDLRNRMKELLSRYQTKHLEKYEQVTSQILLSGILLEETIKESVRS